MAARPRRGPLGDLARAANAAWHSPQSRSFWAVLAGAPFAGALTLYTLEWDYATSRPDLLVFRLILLGGMAFAVFAASRLLLPWHSPATVVGTYLVAGWLHWQVARLGMDPLMHSPHTGPLRAVWNSVDTPFPLMFQWVVWMTFLSVLIIAVTEMRALVWQLATLERQIADLREESEARIRRLREDWERSVERVLSPRVVGLRSMISDFGPAAEHSTLAAAAAEIQQFCRDQVRALSHELYEPTPGAEVKQRRGRLSDVLRLGFRRPGVNLLYAFPLAVGGAFQFYIQRASLRVVALSLLSVGVAALFGLLVVWATNSLKLESVGSVVVASGVFIGVHTMVTGQLLAWVRDFPGLSADEVLASTMIAQSFPAALFLCWLGLGIALTWRHGMELFSERLEEHQLRLVSVREEAIELENSLRRRLALVLHGSVQGKLAAAALALTLEPGELIDTDPVSTAERLLDEVLLELHAVVAGELDPHVGIADRVERMSRDWEGILDVSVEIDATTGAWIDAQPHVVTAVEQVLQEAAANALSHGNARWLQGKVWRSDGVLRAQLVSDSQPEPHQSPGGIGLDAIRSTGAKVDFFEVPGRFTLEVSWA